MTWNVFLESFHYDWAKEYPRCHLKVWFFQDSNGFMGLIFNHEKYHFLLELLSCDIMALCLNVYLPWLRAVLQPFRMWSRVLLLPHNSQFAASVFPQVLRLSPVGRTSIAALVAKERRPLGKLNMKDFQLRSPSDISMILKRLPCFRGVSLIITRGATNKW